MKNSPGKFLWNLSPPKSKTVQLEIRGEVQSEPTLLATEFNKYFQSVFFIGYDYTCISNERLDEMNTDLHISDEGILKLLLNIDTKKTPGPDNITNQFFTGIPFGCLNIFESYFASR